MAEIVRQDIDESSSVPEIVPSDIDQSDSLPELGRNDTTYSSSLSEIVPNDMDYSASVPEIVPTDIDQSDSLPELERNETNYSSSLSEIVPNDMDQIASVPEERKEESYKLEASIFPETVPNVIDQSASVLEIPHTVLDQNAASSTNDSEPLYYRAASLIVEKVNEPTLWNLQQIFRLLPEGFSEESNGRKQHRQTLIGTNPDLNDIVLAATDPYCSRQ